MIRQARIFRVFVSSTFQDLKEERNALQERVFPRLRELCAEHGARFQAIDLRWGVSEEASIDQQTMNICLGEIARCQEVTPRPNFVVLLGDRYGWCPPPPQIPAAEFVRILASLQDQGDQEFLLEWYSRDENAVPPEYYLLPRAGDTADYEQWTPVEERLQRILEAGARRLGLPAEALAKYTTSATEQEIIKGAMQVGDAQDHVFCFFRSIEGLPDDQSAREYADRNQEGRRDTESATRLRALKERLGEALPGNVHHYGTEWSGAGITLDHLDQLCEDVTQRLSKVILDEINRGSSLPSPAGGTFHIDPDDALDEEALAHHRFAEERLEIFVGRSHSLGTIRHYVTSRKHGVLGILGDGGTGKSSLMAKAIEQAHVDHPMAQLVYRFIGTTPDSSNVQSLLESLCHELDRRYGAEDEQVSNDYHELVTDFFTRLGRATARRPLILFLDALDQLTEVRSLAWVPDPLPEHVHIILSTRPGDGQRSLELRQAQTVVLEAMPAQEGDELLARWLAAANRTLQEGQRLAVLEGFRQSEGRPLYLKLAFEEARRWKSGSGEPPEKLMPGIAGIIEGNLLGRLAREDNHSEVLVSQVLGYLAASRYGLAEDELLDLLSRDRKVYAWFLRSVFHYPQDILAAALEYLRSRVPLISGADGAPGHDEEAAAQAWLDKVRTKDKELDEFLAEVLVKPGGPRLPVVLWSRFYFDLQPYLSSTQAEVSPLMGFFHRELGEVASEQFLAGGHQVSFHAKMADYFRDKSDPSGAGTWDGAYVRGLSELPYHLTKGGRWDAVRDTLADFFFLQAKTEALGPQPLIDDYGGTQRNGFRDPSLGMIGAALQLSAHVLADDRAQLASQLTGRLLGSDLRPVRELLDQAQDWERHWLRTLTAGLIQPGGPLLCTLVGHRGPIAGVAFTADGKHIVSKSGDGTARIWDLETGDALRVITDTQAAEQVWQDAERQDLIRQDPNGRLSIVPVHDIVEVREGDDETSKALLIGHNHEVKTWAFSPDGAKLVTGGQDHTVRVWDLEGGSGEQAFEHPGGVTAVAAARDGARAISGGTDGRLRVWDPGTGVETVRLVGHRDRINALAMTADGQRAVSASSDGTLKVWDLSRKAELHSLSGHDGSVRALAVTADGRQAISTGEDQTLRAWDLESGKERSCVEGPQSWDPALAIAPDGRRAAAAYRDRTLRVWDLDSGALMATCIGHLNTVNAVVFSPDGRRLVSGSDDQTVRIWDADTGIEEAKLTGHWDSVRGLDFPTYDRLVSLARDDTLRLWDPGSGREMAQLGGRKVDPSRISQSPAAARTGAAPNEPAGICTRRDGKRGVSFYINDDTLRLWDFERGEQIAAFTGDFVLACCAMGDDASIIAGTRNGRVTLLRLEGTSAVPVSVSTTVEEAVQAKPSGLPALWRIEPAWSEEQVHGLGSGILSEFMVYQLIPTSTTRPFCENKVALTGTLTCACGYGIPLKATINFTGFLKAPSHHPETCPRCNRSIMIVGETTGTGASEKQWLLVQPTTGPPGVAEMPGTPSGWPELSIETIERVADEGAESEKKHEALRTALEAESREQQVGKVTPELAAGDVLAMAIVYEGHISEEPDPVAIANELLTGFSEAGVLAGVTLHPYSAIRMRRADESAWYGGDYEPGDELPQMLEEGIAELRDRLIAAGRTMGQVNARSVKLKGRSRVVSTCWVGMHILC